MNKWKDILVMFGVALSTTLAWHTFRWYLSKDAATGLRPKTWLYSQQDTNLAGAKDVYVKSLESALRKSASSVAQGGVRAYKGEEVTNEIKMYKSEN